eukprot:scaffold109942_cov60-Phaeocystis_antarctica.AAC.2
MSATPMAKTRQRPSKVRPWVTMEGDSSWVRVRVRVRAGASLTLARLDSTVELGMARARIRAAHRGARRRPSPCSTP